MSKNRPVRNRTVNWELEMGGRKWRWDWKGKLGQNWSKVGGLKLLRLFS